MISPPTRSATRPSPRSRVRRPPRVVRAPTAASSKADFTSLSDRMSYLLVLRVAMGVDRRRLGRPPAGGARHPARPRSCWPDRGLPARSPSSARSPAADHAVARLLDPDRPAARRRAVPRGAMYATGGTQSPIRFLVFLAPGRRLAPGLVPDRPEDRPLGLAAAVRRPLRRRRPALIPPVDVAPGVGHRVRPDAGPQRHVVLAVRPRDVRSSRRSTSASCASAGPTSRRSSTSGPGSTPSPTPSSSRTSSCRRWSAGSGSRAASLLGESDGRIVVLATHGIADAPTTAADADWIVRRAWERREILPVKQLDADTRPVPRRRSCRTPGTCSSRR